MPPPPRPRPAGPAGPPPPSRSDFLEKLYVYWLVSTVLLVLALMAVVLMTRGTLQRHATTVRTLAEQVTALEEEVRLLRMASPAGGAAPVRPRPATLPAASGEPASPATRRGTTAPCAEAAQPRPPTSGVVEARLDALLARSATWPGDVRDPAAALALLDEARAAGTKAGWAPATYERLATLARLLGRDAAAEALVAQAGGRGGPEYLAVTARAWIARQRFNDALAPASALVDALDGAPAARTLLAAALLGTGQPAAADEVLTPLPNVEQLAPYDQLLLGRTLVALERWADLRTLIQNLGASGEVFAEVRSFLTAIAMARSARSVEALAVLDYLAETRRGPTASAPQAPAWGLPRPERYDIEVWRGIALTEASEFEAGRAALLRAAELDPGRSEAHLALGLLEIHAQRPDQARAHLRNALASTARLAPAWEALALLEIEDNELNAAAEHLAQALEINPRRAAAHFLDAVVQCRLGARDAAAAALRAAFRLDPRYVDEARQAEVIGRMFAPADLAALASENPAPESGPAAD